jgi:hypothetical protein
MKCRKCGTEIAAKAIICYKCGTATTEPVGGGLQVGGPGGRSLGSAGKGGATVPPYVWIIMVGLVAAVAIWWFQYR